MMDDVKGLGLIENLASPWLQPISGGHDLSLGEERHAYTCMRVDE